MSVFTPVSEQQLITHLQLYSIGELVHYEGIVAGVENTNFFVTTNQGEFVLTLFEAHGTKKLMFYLDLMEHLARAGIPSIKPILSKQTKLLHELNGKPASFVERIKGSNPEQISLDHCLQIGEMLAHFHLAALSYPKQMANEFDLTWQKNTFENWRQQLAGDEAELLQSELAYQLSLQKQTETLPSGIIHGDLFRDNSLFIESHKTDTQAKVTLTAILDLYTACNDTLLIDLAIVINDWCFKAGILDEELAYNVINSYQTIRPLEKNEKDLFITMLRASALRFWVLRLDLKYNPRITRQENAGNAYDPDEYKQKLLEYSKDEGRFMRLLSDV